MNRNTNHNIEVQGHRGCRGLLPENTLPAFKKAIELGVQTIELDIAITKDKQVVVSHEPFMSRTICLKPDGTEIVKSEDMQFNLYEMTHDEIKQFDCGTKFHPRFSKQEKLETYKPLLSEVFELVKTENPNVKINIEVKSKPEYYGIFTPHPRDYVQIILKEVEIHQMFNQVNLQSFDMAILEEIYKQYPKMRIALLIDDNETIIAKMKTLSFTPEIISPYYKLLNKATVEELQAQNFKVIPWTINEIDDMKQMIDFEVDGIITDYPDKLIKLLATSM